MNMVRIRFANPSDDARGSLALAQRFKVICLPEDTYEVPEEALTVLREIGISVTVLHTEGFDHALRTLRNPSSAKI
jgi:hypothetical protein